MTFKSFKELAIYWGIYLPVTIKKACSMITGKTECKMTKQEIDREMRSNRHSRGWGK